MDTGSDIYARLVQCLVDSFSCFSRDSRVALSPEPISNSKLRLVDGGHNAHTPRVPVEFYGGSGLSVFGRSALLKLSLLLVGVPSANAIASSELELLRTIDGGPRKLSRCILGIERSMGRWPGLLFCSTKQPSVTCLVTFFRSRPSTRAKGLLTLYRELPCPWRAA